MWKYTATRYDTNNGLFIFNSVDDEEYDDSIYYNNIDYIQECNVCMWFDPKEQMCTRGKCFNFEKNYFFDIDVGL